MNITGYLTFNGNCREAMKFYKSCLGGHLHFQTLSELPFGSSMPGPMKKAIVHATLIKDNMVIMASDMVGTDGLVKGNSISLMLLCNSEDEIRDVYEKLSREGEKTHPLKETVCGALFGDLIDKYGNQWLLNYTLHN